MVTPPNYGQGLYGVVTMYDVVYDLFCRTPAFGFKPPAKPSFWRHIYPMLERLVGSLAGVAVRSLTLLWLVARVRHNAAPA